VKLDPNDKLISRLQQTIHGAVRVLAMSIAYWLIHSLPKDHLEE
jgi:hypothetical protein